jgi:hypothetical protein
MVSPMSEHLEGLKQMVATAIGNVANAPTPMAGVVQASIDLQGLIFAIDAAIADCAPAPKTAPVYLALGHDAHLIDAAASLQ